MTSTIEPLTTAPGRLGDPALSLATDPRIHPSLLATLAALGLDAHAAAPTLDRSADLETILASVAGSHEGFNGLYAALPNELPGDEDHHVVQETITIDRDGLTPLALHVFRPANTEGPLPGVVYVHGGGMTILDTRSRVHDQWCTGLAAQGAVAIAVDFRNAWTPDAHQPFPAGLDDCLQAVNWIHEHRAELGLTSVVLQGESGGANLVLATALRANSEGLADAIDGVYACVPYVSGGYGWSQERKLRELPSLVENEGYFINTAMMDLLVVAYDPTGENAENPHAWPYFASTDDLRGLPPHVITVNELDPLRDEGLAYWRRLLAAGVEARGHVNLGLVHGAELIFRQALPDQHRAAIRDIVGFTGELSR